MNFLLVPLGAVFIVILHTSNGMSEVLNFRNSLHFPFTSSDFTSMCSATAVTIGFTETDYPAYEETGEARLILTVADSTSNLTIPLIIQSFEQFFNDSNSKLPEDLVIVEEDPAECKRTAPVTVMT